MRSALTPHRIRSLGRSPTPLWLRSVRKYSDVPGLLPDSSKATSPAKKVREPLRNFFKVAVQDGFQGTFEEFTKRMHVHAYERAVKLGRFQGTYDAWRYEIAPNRKPGSSAYISSLRLNAQTGQLISIAPNGGMLYSEGPMSIKRHVLVNGQAVGQAIVLINCKYKAPTGTLLRMYYDPEKHLLRFQTQDGEPLPAYTDIDLISKAALRGYQPLLVLAHSEGLISALPDGYLPSFDLQTNMKSGYYVRANRVASGLSASYHSTISLPGTLGTTPFYFRLFKPENYEYLRFFPYIHEDQTFRELSPMHSRFGPLKDSTLMPIETQQAAPADSAYNDELRTHISSSTPTSEKAHRIWALGCFPTPPLFHSIRKYSDIPSPSSDSSKATSPTKYVPNVVRRFYEMAVQDGFQGTFEEFTRRQRFHIYERMVKLGRFKGTYDAWRYENATNRTPGSCPYISTLHLNAQTEQYVSFSPHNGAMRTRRGVLVNGEAVGIATVIINRKYKAPFGALLNLYYDPEKHLLRFQTQNGEPLPPYTDIDLISKAALRGYKPLLVLAHSEGLISALPDGYLPSFDLQTNMKSGYYIRANRSRCNRLSAKLNPSSTYITTISLPGALGTTPIEFRLSEPEKFEYLRFFPYIHEDQTFRFWDVERGVDAPLTTNKGPGPWEPQRVKKRFPRLFEHAKRLGYWKDF
ncbi:hypothetical protein M407DRAFT_28842 [Tulasnella calospora MUT 4182]|uniref:Uncharacterized protein n=1 Tax=Tulasnella calospora MUT 4182 TaxID=1051891 RepID=A0A0C3Q9Z2_9AGAM|nr:hypothetical protein M407DRAFT_28842 [Tulasnella calospora MUT 4182]